MGKKWWKKQSKTTYYDEDGIEIEEYGGSYNYDLDTPLSDQLGLFKNTKKEKDDKSKNKFCSA